MEYKITKSDDTNIIFLSGEIDLRYSPDLRKLMLDVYKKNCSLEIDLHQVKYLDSSGVACFVEAYQFAKKNNLGFTLTNISDAVMQVIQLARLDTVFPIKK